MTDHRQIAEDYLRACERGDFDVARSHLAEGFVMIFPGDVSYGDPEARASHARNLYRRVRKEFVGWSAGQTPEGRPSVTSWGTLVGENLAGVPFDGVRYIDVFVFDDDRIVEQHVCNDLAVSRVLETVTA